MHLNLNIASATKTESTTMFLEEHNVVRSMRAGFCVYDSRGFDYDDRGDETLCELNQWTVEGVKHNQPCSRSRDESRNVSLGATTTSRKFAKRQVNCAMVVANMAYLYERLKAGDSKTLESTRDMFSFPGLKIGSKFFFLSTLVFLSFHIMSSTLIHNTVLFFSNNTV